MRDLRRAGRRLSRRLAGACLLLACATVAAAQPAPLLEWRLVAAYPHDREAFTQGLLLHDGVLFESTGLVGRSQLRRVDPPSGRVLSRVDLPGDLFGEGLALAGGHLYQLTWKAGRGFVYRASDLARVGEFRYAGEGWGLAFDGERLIMSDGSAQLRIVDPRGFREQSRISVSDGGVPVTRLNELEFVAPHLYANVWGSDRIARIDLATGRVTGWLDLAGLLGRMRPRGADVLNGIAWDPVRGQLWVTGKLWPRIFVLELPR